MLTKREQEMLRIIKERAACGTSARIIASALSHGFNNCTMEGVVKQVITGKSACDQSESLRYA